MHWLREKGVLHVLFAVLTSLKFILCQYHVCLHKENIGDSIQLRCNVDQLAFPVRFFRPNGSLYGSCDAPVDKAKGIVTCGEYLTQDRGTNTTTLTIYTNVSFPIFGVWTCAHGSANATITIKLPNERATLQSDYGWIIVAAISITINFLLCCLNWKRWITLPAKNLKSCNEQSDDDTKEKTNLMAKNLKGCNEQSDDDITEETHLMAKNLKSCNEQSDDDTKEKTHLMASIEENSEEVTKLPASTGEQSEAGQTLQDGFSEPCHTCKSPAICAICAFCKHVYCEICGTAHKKYYPEHGICQVQHVYTTDSNIKCKQCENAPTATEVCTECIEVLCDSCADHHHHPKTKMRELNQNSTLSITKAATENTSVEIAEKYRITVRQGSGAVEHPLRICGIAFLSDGRIVLADSYISKLQIFANAKLQFGEELKEEPRGLAAMTENRIAVTFAYTKEITIFKVLDTKLVTLNHITMKDLGLNRLRPFAISCDDGWLAVEVGEGEDGQIVILEENKFITAIPNKSHFAYYTGNTIRLALDRKKQRVFVSAMSRKTVSCVSFMGNVLWTFPVPSPRSLVYISSFSDKNLILASRRCGAIYRLNADDARDDILLAKGKIQSPRYIAYNDKERLLCIQVSTNDGSEELLVFEYRPTVTSISAD